MQQITGFLSISNTVNLVSIEGLRSLTNIGSYLYIGDNNNLASVEGLRSLINVGWFLAIVSNAKLASVEGLRSLKSIGGNGGGSVNLVNNPVLAHGLPFPALTCKTGPISPGSASQPNNAYVTANIAALDSVPPC